MTMKWRIILPLAALVLGLSAAGCASSRQQARQEAIGRWRQVRAGVALQVAEQQLRQGQPERARDSLLEAIRNNPDDPPLRLMLARVYVELADLAGARSQLARARAGLGLEPASRSQAAPAAMPGADATASVGCAIGQSSQAACMDGSSLPAEIDYWQGIVAQAAGQWEQAHDAYQAACLRAPDSAEYLCALLEAKLALGRPREVVDLAAARFDALPTEVRLRLLAAGAAVQLADLEQARTFYEQALRLEPACQQAKEGLARVLCRSGRYEQAANLLQELPDRKDLRSMLATAHLACGRYETAERLYETCLADDPDQAALRLRRSEAQLLAGRTAQARRDLEQLLQHQCGLGRGWELLGHACVLEGDWPAARLAYDRALECGGEPRRLRDFIDAIERRADGRMSNASTH